MEDYIRQRIGKTLGERWRLESVLGVGGMAAVYAAKDASGQEVAVKVLHPEIGMRPEIRDRFMREGYVANKIQHPGVVQVLEHGAVDEWSVFLVMERLVGESLADRVTRQGTLHADELLDVLDQVLDVLAAAHAAGVVHRDLKPDNLFVLADGRIKVLDFGLARVLDGTPDDVRTRTGLAMGTMPYMAPEQALGKRSEIDGRVDIFALGATAFRILARRRIHEADSDAGMLVAMATSPAPLLLSVAPHVAEPFAMIVDLALTFNRDARYPDARSMQADVRAVRAGRPPEFALARRQTRDEPTRVGMTAPAVGAPPSAASPSGTPTVVARLDAPTQVAELAAATAVGGFQAPTAVARFEAPTVVAPLDKPTALGMGPPGPALAPPAPTELAAAPTAGPNAAVGVEPLVSAVSVRGAPVRPARARGLWIAAIVLGCSSAGAALWWIARTPDANAGVAEAAAETARSEAPADDVASAGPVGGVPAFAPAAAATAPVARAGARPRVPAAPAAHLSAPAAPTAPPNAASAEVPAGETAAGAAAVRALSQSSDPPAAGGIMPDEPAPSAPAAPAPAKTQAPAAPSASVAVAAPARTSEPDPRRRGKGGSKGRPSRPDKGF